MIDKNKERQIDMYCKSVEECSKCKFYDMNDNSCLVERGEVDKAYQIDVAPSKRAMILDAAKQCVVSDRESQYGSPEDNFKLIAEFWQLYLKGRCVSEDADICILPEDVAIMMTLLKIARIKTGTFKEDSFVDACGYLACAAELSKE